ncbi:MAG: ribosome maturation factor RimM [Chloroflexota bacterium]|nr:ribosome maturation factor RimM [Chloroflexota bacterium]
MPNPPKYLLLGEILRPHGVRGEVRMRVLTDYPERIAERDQVLLSEDEDGTRIQTYQPEALRMHQEYALLKLKGIDDRDAAERLRELYVLIELEDAVPLDEGEFYLYQIIGIEVVTEDGETLGTVRDVMETGANDVYIIDSERYGEVLLPAIPSVVLKTDIAAGVMTVRLMDGLLP